MLNPRNVVLGTINFGATQVVADVSVLGDAVSVTLLTDYSMLCPDSAPAQGFPARPSHTGSSTPEHPHTIPSGTTFTVLQCEATALTAVGAI